MQSYDIVRFGEKLQEREHPTPSPSGTEVLLRVTAAGVCHSDLHILDGYFDLGGGKKLSMAERGMKLPHTLGHETVGTVVAAGPGAIGIAPGGSYLVYPWIGCSDCAICQAGEEQLCLAPRFLGIHHSGGYADHIVVPHPRYLLDVSDLPPGEAAPYACSGLTTYGALRKIGPAIERDSVVIIGAGGLGLMALQLHRAMNGRRAIAVDIDPAKREAATRAGAYAAIDGAATDAVAQIKEAAGGQVWSVIDLVGSETTARLGIDSLTKGGKLIVVGLFGGAISLSLPLLPQRALTLQGSYVGSPGELRELLALVRRHKIPSIPIRERPLREANSALEALRAGSVIGRTVLRG
ncbi:MAG: NAD-dependent alcohol dehydrogenase [Rhodospirillales bacterium]|nr:NAD-dependent alcohol dehydrogenase [Rhodospirillales bacterium]